MNACDSLLLKPVLSEQSAAVVLHVLTRVFVCVGRHNGMDTIKLMCNYFAANPTVPVIKWRGAATFLSY